MITEDYVSFETAKLLKENRFDGSCHNSYLNGILFDSSFDKDGFVKAPTLQMAMKWLREIHKIDIAIYPYGEYTCNNYQFDVYKDMTLKISKDDGFMQYEQALEAAIKYCLENLI